MKILGTILKAFFSALFELFQRNAEQPKVAQDAQTPDSVKRDWNSYTADQLRDKPDGIHKQRD